MEKNDLFEIEITGLTEDGDGVGRAEGMAVFVPYALPGDVVRVIIIKVLKNYAIGKLMDIIKPIAERTKSECEYFYKCGGCQFWNVSYEKELEYKRQKVEDCLRRIGGIDVEVPAVIGADSCRFYRNKGQFPVSKDGIGMYAHHSHRVIDMDKCIIQDETNPKVIACVRDWMKEYGISAYNEENEDGIIRHIYTRVGENGLVVCVVANSDELPHVEALVEKLRCEIPTLRGVLHNINTKNTNVVLDKKFKKLWGEETIIDSIGNFKFKISPLSFYQVNNAQTKRLYDKAKEFAELTGKETIWDVYCGIGTIGQYLSDNAKKLVGIEIVEQAVENAKENAKLNGIKNAEYYCGAAEKVAPKLVNEQKTDVVILDPPRKGCDEKLLKAVAQTGVKKIVYISCKPSTLARDLKILESLGYETKKVCPVDLFPRTVHVETVVLLSRMKADDVF